MYKQFGTFKVASNSGYIWEYFNYKSNSAISALKRGEITDRDIMKDEIIIESDLSQLQMNRGVARQHKKKLIKYGIAFEEWFSGNKSFHIQTNFPELKDLPPNDRKEIKRAFLLWLYDFDKDKMFKHKMDQSLCAKHLIRLEYSKHPETKNQKVLRDDHETDRINMLPTSITLYIDAEKAKPIIYNYDSVYDKECIMFFNRTPVSDCRHRIGFVLFNQFKCEFGVDKSSKVLSEWNKSVQDNHLSPKEINDLIYYGSKHNKTPGCRYIKDILMELGVSNKICKGCTNG